MTALLGMMGPATPRELRAYLELGEHTAELPPGIGGTPVNLLTGELLRRGHRVVLFTLDPTVDREQIYTGPNLKICVGPWRRGRPARDFFAAERAWLRQAIRREQPDLLHAQWTYEYALPAQASGLPHVITAHDAPLNVLRLNPIPYRLARTFMAYRVLSRARRVVSVAPYVARHLRRWMMYGGPGEVIPNGMPESLFNREIAPRPADTPLTFATILAGWAGRKNGQVAIEAFARLRQDLPHSRLLMFGAGHGQGEPAQQWARQRGFEAGIEFVGQIAHARLLDRLAGEVDVLVHPALEEAQPMALIEAMALTIPVIAGQASGGVPWTLDEGRAGLLVDVTDAHALAQAMARLAGDIEQRRDWGMKGRALAEQRFHIRAVADAYERIYAQMAAR